MNYIRLVCIPCFCCAWACALVPPVFMKMIIDSTTSTSLFTTGVTAKASRLSLEGNRVVVEASVSRIVEGLPAAVRTLALPGEHRNNVKIVPREDTSEKICEADGCSSIYFTSFGKVSTGSEEPFQRFLGTALLRSAEGTFRVHKIYGDGNCVFRAVSYILWGNEDEHRALRALVTRHIRNHWWEYGPFVIAEWNITSPEEYSNFMMTEGVFATELECTVATKLHKMNLSIYREIDSGHGDNVKRVFHNRASNSYGTARLLFSGRSESGHYDVLFLER